MYIKKGIAPKIKNCIVCNKDFTAMHFNMTICSKKCDLSLGAKRSEKKGYSGYGPRRCIICFNEFEKKSSNAKTCSSNCRLILNRQNKNTFQKKCHQINKNNPEYILKRMLRTVLANFVLYNKKHKSFEYFKHTVEEFRQSLESKFLPGMTWENWGTWHIDHIRPLSSFNLICENGSENIEELLKAIIDGKCPIKNGYFTATFTFFKQGANYSIGLYENI